MAIDLQYRLLAMTGQDRKVRLWHLDSPFPLEDRGSFTNDNVTRPFDIANEHLSTCSLQQMTFSNAVTGLTFCARRDILKEAAQSDDFNAESNLPGLAIATSGAEIAFFE